MYAVPPVYTLSPEDALREELRHQRIAEYLARNYPAGAPPPSYDVPVTQCYASPGDAAPPPVSSSAPAGSPARCLSVPRAEKARCVFETLDKNRTQAIEAEEWAEGNRACNMDLSDATLADLHGKMGAAVYADWLAFVQHRPLFLDALYRRQQAIVNADADKQSAEAMKEPLKAETARAEAEEQCATELAQKEDDGLRDIGDAPADLQKQAGDAQATSEAAAEDTQQRRKDLADRQREAQENWQEQQRRNQALREAEAALLARARRVMDADERVQRLEEALALAKKEQEEAKAAKDEAQSRFSDAERAATESEAPAAAARDAEQALHAAERAQAEADDALWRLRRDADQAEQRRAQQELKKKAADQALDAAKQRKQAAKDRQVANDEQVLLTDVIKTRGPGINAAGEFTDECMRENELVAQEIVLREQRDALEKREDMLRQSADEFVRCSSPTTA